VSEYRQFKMLLVVIVSEYRQFKMLLVVIVCQSIDSLRCY
jgi:hypothetical protein